MTRILQLQSGWKAWRYMCTVNFWTPTSTDQLLRCRLALHTGRICVGS
jgi:hypothetical protein